MSDSNSSGMTAIVAIVAIIVILGAGYVVFTKYMGAADTGTTIDVNVPTGDGQ